MAPTYSGVLLIVNDRGITVDREVVVNADTASFTTALNNLKKKHPTLNPLIFYEQELEDHLKAIHKKRGIV